MHIRGIILDLPYIQIYKYVLKYVMAGLTKLTHTDLPQNKSIILLFEIHTVDHTVQFFL